MAGQGECQLPLFDAAAVITDADQAHAAIFQINTDASAAGIDRVFQKLFEHRGRALNDLTGSNLADQVIGQGTDDGLSGGIHLRDYSGIS